MPNRNSRFLFPYVDHNTFSTLIQARD